MTMLRSFAIYDGETGFRLCVIKATDEAGALRLAFVRYSTNVFAKRLP
jgi:hypothetical protein